MATIKVKFRPSTVADRKGSIFYRIIHEREVRQFPSKFQIFNHEWDARRSMPTLSPSAERRGEVLSIREHIRWDLDRFSRIVRNFERRGVIYSSDDIIDDFNRFMAEYSLFGFMEDIIVNMKQRGQVRTAETYESAMRSFGCFLVRERRCGDVMLDCLDSRLMEDYEGWLRNRGLTANSSSFYMRILRAVYNRAVDGEIIENRYPFRRIYTGVDKTVKRALSVDKLRRIKALNLSRMPGLDYARDMFMLSFMLRGMSFVDMAFLRKSDCNNGCVTYRRRKTGQLLSIAWTDEMERIVKKYPSNSTEYLLPIIRGLNGDERRIYRNAAYRINLSLKKIAVMAGIEVPLTLYVARHSWASVARAKGIPLSVISAGMGHDSEMTTRIYLASIDTTLIDRANSLIISSIIPDF